MKHNEQFAVSIHILTYLAMSEKEYVSSAEISRSINTSSVVVRRLMGYLKNAGIITTKRGAAGSKLIKDPKTISLYSVFDAIGGEVSFPLHEETNPDCPIGNQINSAIDCMLQESYTAMIQVLKEQYLSDVMRQINIKK